MASRPKILLVDDRTENLVALAAILRGVEAELLEARSGTQALELLLSHEVALALIDVQMPEMDGFDLAELMRGSLRTKHIPIIFLSAGAADAERVFRGYDSGAVDFLFKPFDVRILRSKVDIFLRLDLQRRLLAEQVAELERTQRALQEAAQRKDEFLAVLSHELRNPLMPIRNSLYILARAKPESDQALRARAIMDRQIGHLARMVDDLLDVTRISRGKIQLHRERLDFVEIVRRTVEDHRPAFVAQGVALAMASPDERLWMDADATRLAQIVGNLLTNAVKFTDRGGRVELRIARCDTSAVLSVRDNGAGISPEIRRRIFEPFAQADRTLDRSRGGLGLGLALVKGMVELHEGTVHVASDGAGRGAEFTVKLPLGAAATEGAKRVDTSPAGLHRPRRVLVVEDNPDGAQTLREALALLGHEVAVAHDGPAALVVARSFGPDVVLCDIGLPGMDGYEVARRLRVEGIAPQAMLIAVTGYALPEDRRRALAAGFTHHLAKPPPLDALEKLLGTR